MATASETIYFYAKNEPFGEFSNFAQYGIELNGKWWPTVEHYFQAQKFTDIDYQEKIRKAETTKKCAELGRSRKITIRADWEDVKMGIMYNAVLKKFLTHPQLKKSLIETKDAQLIENSPNDYFWGGGQDGSGQNQLGKILMRVRSEISALA